MSERASGKAPPDLSGARWRKSSYSDNGGADCVEVAVVSGMALHKTGTDRLLAVRDSKNPDGPNLFFTPTEWRDFTTRIRNNTIDTA